MKRTLTAMAASIAIAASAHAATFPLVYSFTNNFWYTNAASDPATIVRVVVQTTGAVPNSATFSTFLGSQSNLAFSVPSTTNFRSAVWSSATNDYAVKLYTGDRIYIHQTFTNRAFVTIDLLTTPALSSGGGAIRIIASGVTNAAAGSLTLTGDAIGLHSQSGSNSTLVVRANPTNVVSDRITVNEIEWDSTIFTSPENFRAGYINAVGQGTGTDPGAPRGSITLVKSGSGDDYTVSTRYIYGVNGAIVTNDANGNTVVDGGSTNTVSAFFPKSGTNGNGRLYYSSPTSPNNYTYVDLLSTNPGSIIFNGTNLYLGQLLLSTASNTVLFAGQFPAYYQDFQQITNFAVMEDGATIATRLLGINGGTNVTISMETWTNSSGTVGQRATISAGGGGSNYLLYSANTWAESNAFVKTLVAPQITLNGSGRSMSGVNATVGIRGTNLVASGAHSTAAGGRSATASGDDSVVAGGNANTASGTAGAVGGGTANTASGYGSSVPGGANNTASGDYSIAAILQSTASGPRSAAFGTYLNAAGTDTVVFGIGQAATNPLTRYGPRRMYIDSYQTNMGLSVGTTNATHLLEVGGTIRGGYFIGNGGGLSNLPSGVITGVETAVVYTNFDLLYLTSNGALRLYVNTSDADPIWSAVSNAIALAIVAADTGAIKKTAITLAQDMQSSLVIRGAVVGGASTALQVEANTNSNQTIARFRHGSADRITFATNKATFFVPIEMGSGHNINGLGFSELTNFSQVSATTLRSKGQVIAATGFVGDGSGITNLSVSGDGGATGFAFNGLSGSYDPTTRTLGITNSGGGGGITPTSTYGVAIVGSDTNTFITDPGSVSNLVLMSSGPGFIPQFRAHPWASSATVVAVVGALSNSTFAQGWASTSSVTAAANSANATSLQGIAWSAATPSVGWFPVMTAGGWAFTNAAPSSSTGSAVNSISAGTNTMYGNLSVVGTGNVVATSSAAQDGSLILSANSWYDDENGNGHTLSNAAAQLTSLSVGAGNSNSGTNNVSLLGGATFGAGSMDNVAAGAGSSVGNTQTRNLVGGTNATQNGSWSVLWGREVYNGANYSPVFGYQNRNESHASGILSGDAHTNGSSSIRSVIVGGHRNRIAASTGSASILGGTNNTVGAVGGTVLAGQGGTIGSTATWAAVYNAGPTPYTNSVPFSFHVSAQGGLLVKAIGSTFEVRTNGVYGAIGTGTWSITESGLIVNGVAK